MEEFRICLNCGYTRGFHVSFRRDDKGFRQILICPECGASYDIDLIEDRIDQLNPKQGEFY